MMKRNTPIRGASVHFVIYILSMFVNPRTTKGIIGIVVPTKSENDVIFCLNINLYTQLALTRIDRSLVY